MKMEKLNSEAEVAEMDEAQEAAEEKPKSVT